jgi:hypothetical protein
MWGSLSDERTGLSFTVAAGPRQCSHSSVRDPRDSRSLSQFRDSPNMEGQVPVFISPRNMVAQLYPQAPGSHFVASYDSQGYGGGNRTRLHAGPQLAGCSSCIVSGGWGGGELRFQQFSIAASRGRCRGNVFLGSSPSTGRLFWLHYSGESAAMSAVTYEICPIQLNLLRLQLQRGRLHYRNYFQGTAYKRP